MKLKYHITELEIYSDENVLGKLKAFDDCSYELEVKGSLISPDELRDIADTLEDLMKDQGWYEGREK